MFSINFSWVTSSSRTKSWTPTSGTNAILRAAYVDVCKFFVKKKNQKNRVQYNNYTILFVSRNVFVICDSLLALESIHSTSLKRFNTTDEQTAKPQHISYRNFISICCEKLIKHSRRYTCYNKGIVGAPATRYVSI